MNLCYNSNFSKTQNKERCPNLPYYGYLQNNNILKSDMLDWNACSTSIVTQDCNPTYFHDKKPDVPNGMDPVLYNVLNSC